MKMNLNFFRNAIRNNSLCYNRKENVDKLINNTFSVFKTVNNKIKLQNFIKNWQTATQPDKKENSLKTLKNSKTNDKSIIKKIYVKKKKKS